MGKRLQTKNKPQRKSRSGPAYKVRYNTIVRPTNKRKHGYYGASGGATRARDFGKQKGPGPGQVLQHWLKTHTVMSRSTKGKPPSSNWYRQDKWGWF